MRGLRAWGLRFAGLFYKERRDCELGEELESHLQMHIEDNLRSGMNPAEARRVALINLGGIEQAKERYRDQRGIPALETVLQDLRFSVRMLRKNPGFTTVAVITLALGIGANTAVFSVVNAVLLRPLPYREPQQLVRVYTEFPTMSLKKFWMSAPEFLDIQREAGSWESIGAWTTTGRNIASTDEPLRVNAALITRGLIEALGVQPARGRNFTPEEDRNGGPLTALISDGLWRRAFGKQDDIVG